MTDGQDAMAMTHLARANAPDLAHGLVSAGITEPGQAVAALQCPTSSDYTEEKPAVNSLADADHTRVGWAFTWAKSSQSGNGIATDRNCDEGPSRD
jgi:hypothetical protein